MTERNIAAEVLDGLREIGEYRTGKRTLRTVHVEPRPLPELAVWRGLATDPTTAPSRGCLTIALWLSVAPMRLRRGWNAIARLVFGAIACDGGSDLLGREGLRSH